MLKNYLKTAWRGLLNSKIYSVINIGGLATALGIGILLLWWVKGELEYDQFHANVDQIYRVNGGWRKRIWSADRSAGGPGSQTADSGRFGKCTYIAQQ